MVEREPPETVIVKSGAARVWVVLFCIFWLAPITWVGASKSDVPLMPDFIRRNVSSLSRSRLLPSWLRHQQRIACLFTNSVGAWRTYHVEGQFSSNGEWIELDESEYFSMPVFGYRSRMHRILGQAYKKSRGERRIHAVSYFIKDNYDQAHPLGPPLTHLRYTRLLHRIPDLAAEKGRFQKPWLKDVDARRRRDVFGTIDFRTAKRDVYPPPQRRAKRRSSKKRSGAAQSKNKVKPVRKPASPIRPLPGAKPASQPRTGANP